MSVTAARRLPAPTAPVAEAWQIVEAGCVPAGTDDAERTRLRDMFYAGAVAMFDLQRAIAAGSLSPAGAGAAVLGLAAELQVYIEALKEPAAGARR